MKKPRRLLRDQRGDIMVNTLLSVVVFVVIMITFINLAGVFVTYQNLSYLTKNIARSVELAGGVDNGVEAQIALADAALQSEFCEGLDSANTGDIITANYFSGRHIQLRERFTVTCRCTYRVPIVTPQLGLEPVTIDIPLAVTIEGMSEVYWKAGP